jgi:hypothetical protein
MLVWDDLVTLWGKSRGQLRRWFEVAGIHVTPNRAYEPIPGIAPAEIPELDIEPEQLGYNHGNLVAYKADNVRIGFF